jgi:hypothetical protein
VRRSAEDTGAAASQVVISADQLSQQIAVGLQGEVNKFLNNVRNS